MDFNFDSNQEKEQPLEKTESHTIFWIFFILFVILVGFCGFFLIRRKKKILETMRLLNTKDSSPPETVEIDIEHPIVGNQIMAIDRENTELNKKDSI